MQKHFLTYLKNSYLMLINEFSFSYPGDRETSAYQAERPCARNQ